MSPFAAKKQPNTITIKPAYGDIEATHTALLAAIK